MITKELEINKCITLSLGFIEMLGCLCVAEENREDLIGMVKGVMELATLIEDDDVVFESEQLIELFETI